MMVYSNTTPFIALASIDRLDLLPQLFGKIHVAEAVIDECDAGGRIIVPDLRGLEWIVPVADEQDFAMPVLFDLDQGEKQTILLAKKNIADKVIIDERIGRQVAEYLDLNITGTLGVLIKAKSLGLIPSFSEAAMDMQQQGIRYNKKLIARLAAYIEEDIQ